MKQVRIRESQCAERGQKWSARLPGHRVECPATSGLFFVIIKSEVVCIQTLRGSIPNHSINLAVRKKRVRRLRAFIWQGNRALVPVLRDALTSDRGQSWMWQPSRWLQWLHSAFVRVRCRSLAGPEASANTRFRRTRANGREHPPAFAMQKVVGSSPIIRSENPCKKAGAVACKGNDRALMAG
jgi:hypothetical protein